MSRNLLKREYTQVMQKDGIVIDTNERVAKRIEDLTAMMSQKGNGEWKQGFEEGLDAERVEILLTPNADELMEQENQEPVFQGPTPDELIEEAQAEIERMKQEAQSVIEAERRQVIKEAETKGYNDGYAKGMADAQKLREQMEQERQDMKAAYEEQLDKLEPQFVDTLTDIYEHVFDVDLSSYREIIVHLISMAMRKIEGSRSFLIHVSKEDYPYVSMQKKQIMEGSLSAEVSVEIIEDLTLRKNDCLIETNGGIFDCGLGTQLEELNRQLRLLSYEKSEG